MKSLGAHGRGISLVATVARVSLGHTLLLIQWQLQAVPSEFKQSARLLSTVLRYGSCSRQGQMFLSRRPRWTLGPIQLLLR